jgi:NADH-quinone oxidoreductase subunit G
MAETQVARNPELVTLKIDGRNISVPKGTNVLEAARSAGTQISYFCYHPGLSSPAVCRQCLVEVKGQPKLVPSCYTPVAEGMDVLTESEKVIVARQQMLEFTLVNHPVDCPICDKAGECTLQKMYHEWDGAHSRTDVDKRRKPKVVDLGPEIVLDAERCILCTRCIRVCDEVARDHQLEMAYRGDREQLTVAPGKQLDNPYSLNTVDVCPVGALTSKDFRFAMRAWELSTTPSICTGCATGCNDEIHHSKGRIYRLVPRENQDVNKFWMCDEGRFTYKEIATSRVAAASVAGGLVPLEQAVRFAAERLRSLQGAGSHVGIVLSAQATNEANYALCKIARELGFERIYLSGRPLRPERQDDILRHADVNPNTAGMRAVADWCAPGKAKTVSQLGADLASGGLKALWILGEDATFNEETLALFGMLELCLVQASHVTPLTSLSSTAHIVLPAALWAEVDGTFTNAKGHVQRIRRAVEPPGEARSHQDLVALLGKHLSIPFEYPSTKALFREMAEVIPAFTGAHFGREIPTIQLRFAGSRG